MGGRAAAGEIGTNTGRRALRNGAPPRLMRSIWTSLAVALCVGGSLAPLAPAQVPRATADQQFTGKVAFTGALTPAQITADQHNYNPTGFATAAVLRLSTDAARQLTGLLAATTGRVVWIVNAGAFNLVLKDESASSTAANRFALDGDYTLAPNSALTLWYDITPARWQTLATANAGSGITALTGDGTATGPGSAAFTLATVNANVGSFGSATQVGTFTVSGKGLVTAAANTTVTPAWASITGTPTTLAGYGISDAQPLDPALTALAAGSDFVRFTGPATTIKDFTLPNAPAVILTDNATVTAVQGGTGTGTYTLGDTLYSSASNTLAKLTGNTTATKKFLAQTGTGAVSAAPVWDTIAAGDVPTLNQSTTGSAATWTTGRTISLTGDVTYTSGALDGSANVTGAATIANSAVTLAKQADVATATVFYRKTAATGAPEVQPLATLKTDLGLTGTNTGDQTITLTGDVTGTGTGTIPTTFVNIPTGTTQAGKITATNIAAPVTPAAGKNEFYFDSTSKNLAAKNDAGTVNHGIQSRTATANNWIRSIADDGSTTISQPAFTDLSGSATTAQLGTNTATNAVLAQMAAHTFKGNNTAGASGPLDLTAPQLTAEMDTLVGDSGSGGTKGLVPAPAAGDAAANKFLKANATWAVAGSGDVVGPSSATDNALARFDSTTGKLIQNSVVTVGDFGAVAGAVSVNSYDYLQRVPNIPARNVYSNTWISRSASEANTWKAVAWSPELGLFAAVSDTGTNRVMTSPDGVTWTARSAAEANGWAGICWSPALGLFCAVSTGGVNQVMTSPDGITWTARAESSAISWQNITWSPQLGLFCATSNYDGIMTSPDGINWTQRTAAENTAKRDICWSPQLGIFCGVSADGTSRVETSPDGITWTGRTAAEANAWQSLCWSPELGLFVAVSNGGTNRVMTSPDGINWTSRSAASVDGWDEVCWSPELGLFVSVSNGTNIMKSSDGITWTNTTAPEGNVWQSLVWSPELRLFVATSNNGTNRVMTSPTQGIPGQYVATYGVGTNYAFTATAAAIDFGTTDPVDVINEAGTYLILAQVQVKYNAATVAAETATIKVRRTNNTAADLTGASVTIDLPVSTTLTHTYGIVQLPPVIYQTVLRDDSLTIFANVSAALGAGSIDAESPGTSVVAIRLY